GIVESKWGGAKNARFTAHWIHSLTNPVPLSGQGHLTCQNAETILGEGASAQNLDLTAGLAETKSVSQVNQGWAWWSNLAPYSLDWECRVAALRSPRLQAELLVGGGNWRAPDLTITNFHAELYEAQLDGRAKLDVGSRALEASIASNVDPHQLEPVLTKGARNWLANFSWNKAP